MNVTYHMDEDDKGYQMDEEKHDMDENWYREQEKYVQLGFLFCALNAGAGTARRWRSPRSNWESEGERRRTLSHAESTERERERDHGSLRASRDCGHAAKERKQVGGERIRGDWNYFHCCC
jgi:hypothetical protein